MNYTGGKDESSCAVTNANPAGEPQWVWAITGSNSTTNDWASRGNCGDPGIFIESTNYSKTTSIPWDYPGERVSYSYNHDEWSGELGTRTLDLYDEYTDAMLRTNLLDEMSPYSGWQDLNQAAYSYIHTGHVTGELSPVRYRLGLPANLEPGKAYRISWQEWQVIMPDGISGPVRDLSETIIATGSPSNTVWTAEYEMAPPFYPGGWDGLIFQFVVNVSISIIEPATPGTLNWPLSSHCASCAKSSSALGEQLFADLNLGMATPTRAAGHLRLWSPEPSPVLSTPDVLAYTDGDPTVQVLYENAHLRQLKAPQALADIVTNNDFSFDVRFYLPSQITNFNGQLFELSGSPFVTWRIENPDQSTNTYNRLRINEIRGPDTRQYNAVFTALTSTWQFSAPNNLSQEEVVTVSNTNQIRQVVTTVKSADGTSTYKVRRTYQQFYPAGYTWYEGLVEETINPDNNPQITSYVYDPYGNPDQRAPLQKVIRPNGSWDWYTYDGSSRYTTNYHSFGNVAPDGSSPPSASVRRTEYHYGDEAWSYLPGSGDDGTLAPDTPRLVIDYLQNQETARRFTVFSSADRRIHSQATTRGASWDDPSNLFTTNRYFTAGPNQYKLKSVVRPDGTLQTFDYGQDAAGLYQTNMTASGQPDSTFSKVIDGTTNWTVLNLAGQPILSITRDVASGFTNAQSAYSLFDAFGRPGRVTYLDGTHEDFIYGCCGLDYSTNRDGVQTTYWRDSAKRETAQTTLGITTTNILDASGRILQTIRKGSDGFPITLSQSQYNLSGELVNETNALNGVTGYTQSTNASGEFIRTTTYPDGGTRIETSYRDGSIKSLTGTAVHGIRYEYGVETAGPDVNSPYTLEIKLNTDETDSSEWTKTYADPAGRVYKTVYADTTPADLSDNPCSRSFYNNKGQLWKEVDPDGVTTLFTYNQKGEQDYQILAVEAATAAISSYASLLSQLETLKGGTDRITWTTNDVAASHGTTVRRTRTYVWATNGSGASTLISMTEAALDGRHSWQTAYRDASTPVVSHSETAYAANGYRYVTNTAPDNSYTVSTYQNGRLVSVTRRDALNTQLSSLNYSYDPHGRQNTATDARNGVTITGYNNADLVASVTTPNPGSLGSSPQTTLTWYDNSLRVTNLIHPDNTTVTTEYFPTGELKKNYGSRTYPVEYTYDYAGRMKTMKTWKDFAGNTGMAVTIWSYDGNRGWLANKRYADSNGPDYTYTAAGRLKTRTWARTGTGGLRILTTYLYGIDDGNPNNDHGDLVGISYSNDPQSTPAITFTYDRRGRQKTIVQGAATTALSYNDADQLLAEQYTGGTLNGLGITNAYDGYLRRTAVALSNSASTLVSYTYDNGSRLSSVANGSYNANYTYLANSPLVSQIVFKQNTTTRLTTSKVYDFLDRLTSIASTTNSSSVPSVSFGYGYNSANQRTRCSLVDGSFWIYEYDPLGQVKSGKKFWPDWTPVAGQQFEYAHDDIGNRKFTKAGGDENGVNLRPASYTANSLNQYSTREVPGAVDVIGLELATNTVQVNSTTPYRKGEYFRKEVSLSNGSAPIWQSISVTAPNETTVTGNVFVPKNQESFTYDFDGNLTADGRWNYTWDAENRLVRMVANTSAGPQNRIDFSYDWKSRRITKRVWPNIGGTGTLTCDLRFVYDGWNLVATLNATNNNLIQSYVWGTDLSGTQQGAGGVGGLIALNDTTNGFYFAAFDGNGNAAGLVKSADGSVAARYEYGPFAEQLRATGPMARVNTLRFSTKYEDDETDSLYYGLRYYKPILGRWFSSDPIQEDGGTSLLVMLLNDPVDDVDAFGLCGGGGGGMGSCGPDVTSPVLATLRDIRATFRSWNTLQKIRACTALYGPRYRGAWGIDKISQLGFVGRRGGINFLFDPPATPGGPPPCNTTVAYKGSCYQSRDVNYLMWGTINRICWNSVGLRSTAVWTLGWAQGAAMAWKWENHDPIRYWAGAVFFTRAGWQERNPSLYWFERSLCEEKSCAVLTSNRAVERKLDWQWYPYSDIWNARPRSSP